eukprot:scaffold2792_cov77-Cylindrotheca_fusiformis.AAC.1
MQWVMQHSSNTSDFTHHAASPVSKIATMTNILLYSQRVRSSRLLHQGCISAECSHVHGLGEFPKFSMPFLSEASPLLVLPPFRPGKVSRLEV